MTPVITYSLYNDILKATSAILVDDGAKVALFTTAYPLIRAAVSEEAARACEDLAIRVLHPNQTITDRCAQAIRDIAKEK